MKRVMLHVVDGCSTGWRFVRRCWRWRPMRWTLVGLAGCVMLAAAVFAVSEWYTYAQSKDRAFWTTDELPGDAVAVVLGCAPKLGERNNLYFLQRMDAAARLWKSGKVSAMIVSGDNSSHDYNEPEAMKAALVAKGVPEERIVCDFAGLRTLDSVVRARDIFGVNRVIFVSQEFHNERALAIAGYLGMDAYAFNASNAVGDYYRRASWMRERAARVAMMLDLWVLNRSPKYMGKREQLPE